MVKELEEYGWMMFTVLGMRQQSMNALMVGGAYRIVITLKMPVFSAIVSVITIIGCAILYRHIL